MNEEIQHLYFKCFYSASDFFLSTVFSQSMINYDFQLILPYYAVILLVDF